MTKHIKKVEEVLKKAVKNGSAKNNPYQAFYYPKEDIMVLEHYGTKIFQSQRGKIVRLGGYSGSDRDAISTAMTVGGFGTYVSNAKSMKGKGPEINGWTILR